MSYGFLAHQLPTDLPKLIPYDKAVKEGLVDIFLKKDYEAELLPPFMIDPIFKEALVNTLSLPEKFDYSLNRIVLPPNKFYKILAKKYSETVTNTSST